MNSFERYRAILDGQPADFLPRLPILMQFAAEYIGSNYGAFASDYRVLTEANLRCAAEFGIDQMNTMSDPWRETSAFGGKVTYVTDGVPRCTHPLANTRALTALAQPDPLRSERLLDRVNAVRTYRARVGGQASIMGWVEGPGAEAADLRGVSEFMMDTVDDPDFVGELMDRCVAVAIDFARVQIEAGADTIGIGDAVCSQISPRQYVSLILPRQQRLVRAIRDMGAWVRLHICGNITHILPGIASLGVQILDVDHMVDLVQARKAMGPKVVLAGNLDPVSAVLRGTPDAIRSAVRRQYEAVGNPFMVNAGCEIPSRTPTANLKAFCEPIPWVQRA